MKASEFDTKCDPGGPVGRRRRVEGAYAVLLLGRAGWRTAKLDASSDNRLFAVFCRCLGRCLLPGHERPVRQCRAAPDSLYVAGVCLNRIGTAFAKPQPNP